MSRAGRQLAAVALVLAGCAPAAWTPATSWTVEGEVSAAWCSTALDLAACVADLAEPPPATWGGTIIVHPGRFPCCAWLDPLKPCGTCAGLTSGGERVEVAWTPDPLAGALGHELAHAALCRAGRCGEADADRLGAEARRCVERRRAALPGG